MICFFNYFWYRRISASMLFQYDYYNIKYQKYKISNIQIDTKLLAALS